MDNIQDIALGVAVDPVVEVIIEKTPDGQVKETTTTIVTEDDKITTIIEVVTKPKEDIVSDYDDQITSLTEGIQNNLDQADFLTAELAKVQQRKKEASK